MSKRIYRPSNGLVQVSKGMNCSNHWKRILAITFLQNIIGPTASKTNLKTTFILRVFPIFSCFPFFKFLIFAHFEVAVPHQNIQIKKSDPLPNKKQFKHKDPCTYEQKGEGLDIFP